MMMMMISYFIVALRPVTAYVATIWYMRRDVLQPEANMWGSVNIHQWNVKCISCLSLS